MATGKERKQARADRYRERALQAKAGSTAAYRRSEELTKNIPSGQPILVGHHSEKRHRRALECSWNALGKSVELERKADYYAAKAEAAEHNRAIYAEDDDAVENLTERVAALESLQERMKAANRIIKNLKQTQEEKIEALCRLGFERRNAEELFVRLQVFFPEKPSEEVRKELKSNGFRWASIAVCWQSYLNERQKYRIERILKNETVKS